MKILVTWHWRTVTRMVENIVRIHKRVTKRVLSMVQLYTWNFLSYVISQCLWMIDQPKKFCTRNSLYS